MDGVVVAFTLGLALLLGLVIGLVPIVQLARASVTQVLREDSRTGTAGRGARLLRRALVTAQVAVAFVLLIGAGLLLASFQRMLAIHRLQARARAPGSSTRRRRLPGRRRAARVREPDARADPAPARRHRRRRHDRAALRRRQQQQRHPGGRLRDEAGRVGHLAEPDSRDARLLRGHGHSVVRRRYFEATDTADAPKTIVVDERWRRSSGPAATQSGGACTSRTRPKRC